MSDGVMTMHGRPATGHGPEEYGIAGTGDAVDPEETTESGRCAQCGRNTDSSPSGDFCSESCMRRWLRARTRRPEEVLGMDPVAASERMVRRHTYLVATMGSWPDAWRIRSA